MQTRARGVGCCAHCRTILRRTHLFYSPQCRRQLCRDRDACAARVYASVFEKAA